MARRQVSHMVPVFRNHPFGNCPDREGDPSTEAIRILVVEGDPLLAQRLAALHDEYSDLDVVGAAATAASAVAIASAVQPRVALIDRLLPDACSFELCRLLRRQVRTSRVIIVSTQSSDDVMLSAVLAGACGVVSRIASDQDLVEMILRAAEGEFLFPRSLARRLFRKQRGFRFRRSDRP
jgi:two-component system, NarL family, response regulator DevR